VSQYVLFARREVGAEAETRERRQATWYCAAMGPSEARETLGGRIAVT
jgi:hypothetical protein